MKNDVCLILIFGFLFLIPGVNYALDTDCIIKKDTIKNAYIHFPPTQDGVDIKYWNNSEAISVFDSLFSGFSERVSRPDSVMIISLVAAEGDIRSNTCLAAQRGEAIKEYLIKRYPCLHTRFVLCCKKMDCIDIRNLIEQDPAVPNREDVLQLIDYHHDNPAKCKELLQYLNGHKPYRYITEHILPRMHRAEIRVVWNYPDLVAPLDEIKPVSGVLSVTGRLAEGSLLEESVGIEENTISVTRPVRRKTIFAIKNNLLYDLALAPNLEVELPIGRRWSLNAEYKCPWWLNDKRNFCYQLLSGGVEARCWLGNRNTRDALIGHFLGLYAEGGTYDFQFGETEGYQGKYYAAAGFSYGYTRHIARNFSLEFSLGVGCLATDFRTYVSKQGKLFWKDSRRCVYVGPTKAKISLVWLINVKR